MRVFVLGGHGFIGSSVVAHLTRSGFQIVGLTRSPEIATRYPTVEWRNGDLSRLTSVTDWRPLIADCNAIVNCAGALQDSPRDSLAAVHIAGPMALYRACVELGIRRVVHVSSAGIGAVDTRFGQTKREAEAGLTSLDLDWVILRPGLVIGPNAFGGTALLRGIAGFPLCVPIPNTERTIQIVSIYDVAETIRVALKEDTRHHAVWELVHPNRIAFSEIVLACRAWLGFRPCPICKISLVLVRLVSLSADVAAYLGWRSPLRSTSLKQLDVGVHGDPKSWMDDTGIQPRSLQEIFMEQPAGLQERWFARTYFVKPLGLIILSLFWIYSGLIGLGAGFDEALRAMRATPLPDLAGAPVVIAGSMLDICLGLAVLIRRTARAALIGMIIACSAYIVGGSLLYPELWVDPFGALAKALPVAFAALAVLSLMDER